MRQPDRLLGNWLLLLCCMVFGMVAGGGHARTLGAGFILQVWQPLTGFLPPRGAAGWAHLFGLYQRTAQYRAMHPAMRLAQFETLFWPVFLDRLWGRLMALVFLLPLAVFWWRGRISTRLACWLIGIFAAGGAEAALGWLMVRTGMRAGVLLPPPVWLAPHFAIALLIFAALLATGLHLRDPAPARFVAPAGLQTCLNASLLLIWLTASLGALVAGNDAVHVFNSFPTMDGRWIPAGIARLHPLPLNFLANPATVQFDHRLLATLTALLTLGTCGLGLRAALPDAARDAFLALAGLLALQYLLGMLTVLAGSARLGYVHELNALLLFAAAIVARHHLRGAIGATMYSGRMGAREAGSNV